MLKQKYLTSLIVFLIAISVGISVSKAEGTEIYVSYQYADVDAKFTTTIQDIIDTLRNELEKRGYKLITTNEPLDGVTVLNIQFGVFPFDPAGEDTPLHATFEILQSPLQKLSPLLTYPSEHYIYWDMPERGENAAVAFTLYAIGDCANAKPYLKTLVGAYTRFYLDFLFLLADCALVQQNYASAEQIYQNLIQYDQNGVLDSESRNIAANLSWTYLQMNETQKAFNMMDDYVKSMQTCILTFYNGDCAERMQLNYLNSYTRRAQFYALTERYNDAITDLTAAIELPEDDTPDLYIQRGKMYLAQYEWDSALDDYNKAIELDPTYADAYYERGVLYYSILQTGVELRAEAFDDFHRYLELAPDGDHAADALRYTAQIEKELEALNG